MSKLPHAPLQEVIFEIRWMLRLNEETGQMHDTGFELTAGRLSALLEPHLPVYRRIVSPDVPEHLIPYRAVHQYWTAENTWPMVQLGPGIFTVNCTEEHYEWKKTFFPLIRKALQWITQAYRQPLVFSFASLRYINAVKVSSYGGLGKGWQAFISKNFNFTYNDSFKIKGHQKNIQVNQIFELKDGTLVQVQLCNGLQDNEQALLWQTAVFRKHTFEREQLVKWIDGAHNTTRKLFKDIIKPSLYASFKGKKQNKA